MCRGARRPWGQEEDRLLTRVEQLGRAKEAHAHPPTTVMRGQAPGRWRLKPLPPPEAVLPFLEVGYYVGWDITRYYVGGKVGNYIGYNVVGHYVAYYFGIDVN